MIEVRQQIVAVCDADGCGAEEIIDQNILSGITLHEDQPTSNGWPPDSWTRINERVYCPKHRVRVIIGRDRLIIDKN